jgi:1-acyl-sn-glycerol-3-phosphate acyltransferase
VRRLPTHDWSYVGWHYKAIHILGPPWHNRLWLRGRGFENVPDEGGFLFAGNHTSWWDPIVLQTSIGRPVNWLAKKEMMNNRFNKWFFFDKGGCIPVDRNAKNPDAFYAAAQALRDGRVIGIFPEGTRHVENRGPPKTGVARLALEADAPIVPVGILTDRFWPAGRKVPDLTERIYVNVGAPMRFSGDAADPKVVRDVTDQVMARVAELLDEARDARERGEKWPAP